LDSKYARNFSRVWLVVSNRVLLDHAPDERGVVTLLQQIPDQFVSPDRCLEVSLPVTEDQLPAALVVKLLDIVTLAFFVVVFADRAGRGLAIDAGGLQLVLDFSRADLLEHPRADVRAGETLVVEPFLITETGQRLGDVFAIEFLRREFAAKLTFAVEPVVQNAECGEIAIVGQINLRCSKNRTANPR
jgi:hypothetical protein